MNRIILAAVVAVFSAPCWAQQPDANSGRNLAAACAMCHGTGGANAGGLPDLRGQAKEHIAQQLRDFRDGKRPATVMHQIAKGYTELQITALADFFAAQKAR
jgi:sulfide dehydrogenase cytochrome subunit